MPNRYPTVPMPQAQSPGQTLGELMQFAGGLQRLQSNSRQMQDEDRQRTSQVAVETALRDSGGDLDKGIASLESAGHWTEASALRQKSTEYRKTQQEELAAGMKRSREGLETATRYLQGVEAAESPEEKSRLFAAVRPKIVEAMPGFDQHIPQRYEDDPGFVARAIPFGLSVSDVAHRRSEAVAKINEKWRQAGDQLGRDKAVLEHLTPWLETSDTGEEVNQILAKAEQLYSTSPAVKERIGEVPPGPLTPEWKASLAKRLGKEEKEPGSIDAAILVADRKGDKKEVQRLIGLKSRTSAAGRAPDEGPRDVKSLVAAVQANPSIWKDLTPSDRGALAVPLAQAGFKFQTDSLTQAEKNTIERWRTNEITRLNTQRADPLSRMTDEQYASEKERIESSYRVQIGTSGVPEQPKPAAAVPPPAPVAVPAPQVKAPAAAAPKVTKGDTVTVKGKQYVVGEVFPDGSWNPR